MKKLCIIILMFSFCMACDMPPPDPNDKSAEQAEALKFARDCVRNSLRYPESAKFPWLDYSISDGPYYRVTSCVTVPNGLGFPIKVRWWANVHKDGGTWKLDRLKIDEYLIEDNPVEKESAKSDNHAKPEFGTATNVRKTPFTIGAFPQTTPSTTPRTPAPSSNETPIPWPQMKTGSDELPYRMWKSNSGSAIKAKLVDFSEDETEITLEREDGKRYTLKISRLSEYDEKQAKKYIDKKKRFDGK